MTQNETFFYAKNAEKFECLKCDFKCFKNSDWERHILTLKHQNETNETKMKQKNAEKNKHYKCSCGQFLNSRSTIWRHKKKCQNITISTKEETLNNFDMSNDAEKSHTTTKILNSNNQDNDIIKMLIKDNSELKSMMLEVVKSIQPHTMTNSHNTTNNTTNNHFNLQIYLNETCKDAINLTDFVEGLQVKLKDLEETARLGYSEGVSKIFINGLNELEVNKRPIHCSDAKRETLYIKNQNEWTKDADKALLTSAIKTVGKKNIQQIFEWQKKYPEYNDPASRQNDKYLKMLCNAMNGSTDDEQEKNMEKIIRNITKEVIIDKNIVC